MVAAWGSSANVRLHSAQSAKLLARGAGLRLLATLYRALDGDLGRVEQGGDSIQSGSFSATF